MKNTIRKIVLICFCILGCCFSGMVAADAGKSVSITVVMSGDSTPYQQVLTGFKKQLTGQGIRAEYFRSTLSDDGLAPETMSHNGVGGPRIFLAIGQRAIDTVTNLEIGVPIVTALGHDTENIESSDNVTGVLLKHPVNAHFEFMKRIMPDVQRVGFLFNPKENSQLFIEAQSTAKEYEIELMQGTVGQPSELPAALRFVANTSQAIWGIPDQSVFAPETAKHLLVYSFRNRIPLVGLSNSWVKAGALYSLERDYFDIGAQCGELAGKILAGTPAGSLQPLNPRKIVYVLNLRTARHMKLELDPDIIAGASQVYD